MIKNVNLMQHPLDLAFDENSEYSKEHIIHALANLGQRIGIKGDSITYKSFNFNDISLNSDVYDSNEYVGYIEYIKDDMSLNYKALFGVVNKFDLITNNTILDSSINIDNTFNFPEELSFSIPISGIEKYSKNSICINDNDELTFMLIGKKIGYYDKDKNNTVLMYYKFDVKTNRLISGYKLFWLNEGINKENYYCLISINKIESDSLFTSQYQMNINIFNSSELLEYKDDFEYLFNYNNYHETSYIPFSIVNKKYKDINELLYFDENIMHNNSAISIILGNTTSKSSLYDSKTINLVFNTNKNELLTLDDQLEDYNEIAKLFKNEYGLNLNEELYNINEDINKLYVNIFNYYNEKFYVEERATLVKRILSKIYERSVDYKKNVNRKLYIPLDYEFHYICNSNNDLNIYYSNNIYITYTSLLNKSLDTFWALNNNLVFDYQYDDYDKLKVYNFEVLYNNYIDNLINNINIKEIYVMPYINANNNWCINDSDTKIKAVGEDAGNPNIIVIYNKDNNGLSDSYEILNSISNKKEIEYAEYNKELFSVNIALFNNINDIDIKCCAYIPKITNQNYKYFKDSIILSISDLNCLEYDTYKANYKGSYIITLWGLAEIDNNIKFRCLNQSNTEYALALGATVNMFNEVQNSSTLNLNSYDLILLKSIISNVAQESLAVNMNNWLILKNKQSEEYVSDDSYSNDLNMIIQYNDKIQQIADHIIHSQTELRYISDFNKISVTDTLYPKYEYVTTYKTTKENYLQIIAKLEAIPQETHDVRVNDGEITTIDTVIEYLKTTYSENETEVIKEIQILEKSIVAKDNYNYNEYVFNSNVPSLDQKEIINRNVNVLNRLNLLSLDQNGKLYNSYIGTSFNDNNKNVLHIGSNSLNINIGSDTLINEVDRNNFAIQDTLSLDFDNIFMNASKSIINSKTIINREIVGNTIYYSFNANLIDNYSLTTLKYINGYYQIDKLADSIFGIYNNNGYITHYIILNSIMKKYANKDLSNYSVNIKLNYNDELYDIDNDNIIKTSENSNSNSLYLIKINSNKLLYIANGLMTTSSNNAQVLRLLDNVNIMYYESTNNINICISIK